MTLVVCAACHSSLTVPRQNHSVLFFDYAVHCAKCNKDLVSEEKDVYKKEDKNGKVQSFVKRTIGAVYGTLCSGKGHATFARITTSFGLKQLARSQFHKYKNLIFAVAKAVLDDHLKAFCALVIWNYYVNVLKVVPDKDGIIDIYVTFDGSWKTRGFSSVLGAAAMIEAYTGVILDFVAFSKKCRNCTLYKNKLQKKKITETDFKRWEKTHKESGNCEKNFDESSGMMEVRGAEIMCKSSIEKYKMRYKYIISDGDTKTFSNLEVVKPYGPNFEIEKLDCINHIGKRMGKGLMNAKNEPLLPEVLLPEYDFNETSEVKKDLKSTPSTKKGQSGEKKIHCGGQNLLRKEVDQLK